MRGLTLLLFFTLFMQSFFTACSDRVETPIKGRDSTIVYTPITLNGIEAKIKLGSKVSRKTGKLSGVGTVFQIKDKAKVYAVIKLVNRKLHTNKILMFHLDWLDPDGNSIFKKRIDLPENDSSSILSGSINISPGKRQPGKYSLRVYLFRELIAEKQFELADSISELKSTDPGKLADSIEAVVTFCKGISKKTEKPIGEGTVFTIKNKVKVVALIRLNNKPQIRYRA